MDLTHKLPPQNIEAEESVLASMMINNKCIDDVVSILKPEDFYKPAHQKIFHAIIDLNEGNEPVDLTTLSDRLRSKGFIEQIGGASYLAKIITDFPVSTHIIKHSEIIKSMAIKRQGIDIAHGILENAFDYTYDAEEFVQEAQKAVIGIETKKQTSQSYMLSEAVTETIERLDELQSKKGVTGVASGLVDIDSVTYGFQNSDLIILAARPAMGKTSLILNILDNIVLKGGSAAIFSLEMSKEQLVNRMLARHSKINSARFRSGGFSGEEWQRINQAAQKLYDKNLIINDSCDMHYMDIRREARKYKKNHDIQLVAIDYIGLMKGDDTKNRVQEVSSISRNLKMMAKELDIPVIALSQLNRELEKRGNKKPILSDLRESGSLEQDSDIVMFIYRDEVYNDDENNPNKGIAEIIFAKHRNGATCTIKLQFTLALTTFYDLGNR